MGGSIKTDSANVVSMVISHVALKSPENKKENKSKKEEKEETIVKGIAITVLREATELVFLINRQEESKEKKSRKTIEEMDSFVLCTIINDPMVKENKAKRILASQMMLSFKYLWR